jgi:hypothetical protein
VKGSNAAYMVRSGSPLSRSVVLGLKPEFVDEQVIEDAAILVAVRAAHGLTGIFDSIVQLGSVGEPHFLDQKIIFDGSELGGVTAGYFAGIRTVDGWAETFRDRGEEFFITLDAEFVHFGLIQFDGFYEFTHGSLFLNERRKFCGKYTDLDTCGAMLHWFVELQVLLLTSETGPMQKVPGDLG